MSTSISDYDLKALQHNEHVEWVELCQLLLHSKAVTQKDCDSLVGERKTKGQRLFEALRRWGRLYAMLHIVETSKGIDAALLATVENLDPDPDDA